MRRSIFFTVIGIIFCLSVSAQGKTGKPITSADSLREILVGRYSGFDSLFVKGQSPYIGSIWCVKNKTPKKGLFLTFGYIITKNGDISLTKHDAIHIESFGLPSSDQALTPLSQISVVKGMKVEFSCTASAFIYQNDKPWAAVILINGEYNTENGRYLVDVDIEVPKH